MVNPDREEENDEDIRPEAGEDPWSSTEFISVLRPGRDHRTLKVSICLLYRCRGSDESCQSVGDESG